MDARIFSNYFAAMLLFILLAIIHKPLFANPMNINSGPGFTLASNTFIFYPKKLKWVAISNGNIVKSGKASGGSNYCPDIGRSCRTPTGTYSVLSMRGAECRSSRYPVGKGGAKMPYCMFFTPLYAVHGSYEVPNHNASHGCIRVRPNDAKWLQRHFMKIGTTVVVKPY